MRCLIGFAVAAFTALPLTACSFGNEWEYRSEVDLTRTTEHVSEAGIFVDTRNGRIEVVADPQRTDVLIEAHVRCKGRNQQEADQRLAATTLSITRDGRSSRIPTAAATAPASASGSRTPTA